MSMKNDIIEAEFRTKGASIVQRDMSKISKEIAILTENNKDLKLAKAKLEAQDKKYITGTKKLTKEYQNVSSEIKKNNELLTIQKGKLQVQSSKLKLTEMSASQLKKKWRDLNKELDDPIMKVLPERQKRLTKELAATEKQMGKVGVGTKKTMSVMTSLKGLLPAMGFAALVTGLVSVGKKIFDLAQQTMKYRQQIQKLTGESGQSLADLTASIEGSANTFGKEVDEMAVANNTLAKSFGITQQVANELIDKGFISGADASGEFLAMLKEYPTQFKAAGLSAEQSIALMTQSVKSGVYSDKGADVIKEGTLRLREMTKATREALKGVGISSKQLESDLKKGTISYFDAIQMVSNKLGELPPQSAIVGTAIADIFGGPGEDAGLKYIKMLGNVDTNMDHLITKSGESAIVQTKLLEVNKKLSGAWSDMLGSGTGTFTAITAGAKNLLADGLIGLMDGMKGVRDWFIEVYNSSYYLRAITQSMFANWNTGIELVKGSFKALWTNLKTGGKLLKAVLTFDLSGVKEALSTWKSEMKATITDGAKDIADGWVDAYNKTLHGKIEPVKQEVETSESATINKKSTAKNVISEKLIKTTEYKDKGSDEKDFEAEADAEVAAYLAAYEKAQSDLAELRSTFGDAENDTVVALEKLEEEHAAKLISEEEYQEAHKELIDNYKMEALEVKELEAQTEEEEYQAKLALEEERYKQELDAAAKNRLAILKAEGKHEKALVKIEKDKIDAKKKATKKAQLLDESRLQLAGNIANGLANIANKESIVGKAALVAKKAIALSEIGLQLGIGTSKTAAVGFPQNIPLLIAFAAQAIGIVKSVTGLEQGGYSDVVRAQDGKQFRAQKRTQRGFVDKPSILVGEKDPEFVANGTAVKNPTVRPVLDVIDAAQRSGEIHTLDLPKVIQSMPSMRGLEGGGYTQSENSSGNSETDLSQNQNNSLNLKLNENLDKLNEILSSPILAEISYFQFEDKLKEAESLRTRS